MLFTIYTLRRDEMLMSALLIQILQYQNTVPGTSTVYRYSCSTGTWYVPVQYRHNGMHLAKFVFCTQICTIVSVH